MSDCRMVRARRGPGCKCVRPTRCVAPCQSTSRSALRNLLLPLSKALLLAALKTYAQSCWFRKQTLPQSKRAVCPTSTSSFLSPLHHPSRQPRGHCPLTMGVRHIRPLSKWMFGNGSRDANSHSGDRSSEDAAHRVCFKRRCFLRNGTDVFLASTGRRYTG